MCASLPEDQTRKAFKKLSRGNHQKATQMLFKIRIFDISQKISSAVFKLSKQNFSENYCEKKISEFHKAKPFYIWK